MKKIVVIIIYLSLFISLKAQDLKYKIDFDFFFDNLEGSQLCAPTRSLVSAKLAPELGITIDNMHELMVGVSLIQDFGDSTLFSERDYIIYYKFTFDRFNVIAGSFPRSHSIGNYPRSFFREDFLFRNNNIEGLMLQYRSKKKNGFVELFADWFRQNQETRMEEFILTASTEYRFFNNLLIVGANVLLNHNKNEYALDYNGLYERLQYNVYTATDLTSLLPLFDRFRIGFGTNSSSEHKAYYSMETKWQNNVGWQFDVDVNWKGLGLKNEFYFGDPQVMYYNEYGDNMYWGSRFYQAKRYNFIELYYQRKWNFVSLKLGMALQITPDQVANQQMITIGFNIDQVLWRKDVLK